VQKNGPIPEDTARNWLLQLLSALQYIHNKGIAHRDMKLENILLGDDGTLKIADYGFSKQVDIIIVIPLYLIVISLITSTLERESGGNLLWVQVLLGS
jgi:serine/threonine protein kinase